ncbi:MAG: LPS-assembly protein LptD [Alphaproteobacteria bacterium]
MPPINRWLAAGALALCLVVAHGALAAQKKIGTEPVVVRADDLTYDEKKGLVVASGNVEIAQGERVLLADEITYNQDTGMVTATGNVTLLEPSGEVIFADYVELDDEMRRGIIRDLHILLTDGSRFAANGALRTGGNRTEMRKVVFSPCRLCPDHPDKAPLWQIKAVRVVHDEERQVIEYSDAFLEFFGVPVAYTPYFSHPDPTVKRKSGFLTPSFANRSKLGFTAEVPYFFNLAPNRDFTFSPIFTSREGVVLGGEYRERTNSGAFKLSGSITRPKRRGDNGERLPGRDTRGHIKGSGLFDLNDAWRWGFNISRSTDDTYLRRYGFGFEDTLTSRLFMEGFEGRSYAAINGYTFQGLEPTDDPGETPLVLPIADVNFIGDPGPFNGRFTLDSNLMVLTRNQGIDSRRLSVTGGWQVPYLGPLGDIYTLTTSLRGDLYLVDTAESPREPADGDTEDLIGRFVPQLSLDWRYPLIRHSGSVRQIIEPVFKFAVSPNFGKPNKIPNEDSQDFEFDDTNLFSLNRFPGLDRVEGGTRISYGLRMGAYGAGGGRTTAFLGQSFRAKADSTFDPGSGLDDNFSDYVGRVTVSPNDFIDLSYRFRLDNNNFTSRRSEVDLAAGPEWLRFNLGFLSLDATSVNLDEGVGKRQEIDVSALARFSDNWSLTAFHRRDLTADRTIDTGAGIVYEDECLFISVEGSRRFTEDRDFEPETSVKFVIKLKHLG